MVEVQDVWEGHFVVHLVALESLVVKVKPLHHQVEQFGHGQELHSPLSQHFLSAPTAVVFILTTKLSSATR